MQRNSIDQMNETTCIAAISSPSVAVAAFPHVSDRYSYPVPGSARINITVTALWVATPLLSTVSVAAVCVAISTNQWLLTQENIKNENYTNRGDQEFFSKSTMSGLWTLCYSKPGKSGLFCSNIEYFPKEEYSPDLKDSTMAIPYTVTKSALFFILSTILLFVGEVSCLFGHFSRQRQIFTFVSGVIFIVSGLFMLIGLVMYISIFKAEVGGKLRPTSQLQPAVFTYKYGYSFILYVTGFVLAEVSGICAVFLYIYRHQKNWRKKEYNLRSKLISQTNFFDVDPLHGFYPFCRRHPSYFSTYNVNCLPSDEISETFTPVFQRRLYLDHQDATSSENDFRSPVCLKNSISCSVFNELLTDIIPKKQNRMVGTSDDMNEEDPPLPSELCHHHLMCTYSYEYGNSNCFPKDASTNTPSNFLDFVEFVDDIEDCTSEATHDHNFVPFDLEDNYASVPPSCRDIENFICEDEFKYKVLSKTTPV